jgi:ZIP family zinc transporter
MNLTLIASVASLLAGLGTGVGGMLVFLVRKVSPKFVDCSLGFAAGVMLAATFFSLLVPSIEIGGIWRTTVGILLGTIFLALAEKATPHIHRVTGKKGPPTQLSKLWLFIFAIAIHNFPEGVAVGVGFASGDMKAGLVLSMGILLQNVPEGLAVALPLLKENSTRLKAFMIALLTGLVEPVGGIMAIFITSIATFVLPYGLSFAAGAMLFVISEEIIPETHSRGYAREATLGLISGFILMMILDNLFG